MDLYGDDIDTILDAEDPLNAKFTYDDDDDNNKSTNNGAAGDDEDDAFTGGAQKVEPKRRARSTQLRLNAERLIGDRGIHQLEHAFRDMHYKGEGHEAADLDAVMKRMEHWAHRLYPRFNFDDFLRTAEKLGKKRPVQSHMMRYRQGLLDPRPADAHGGDHGADDDDEFGAAGMDDARAEPIDEFDDLIGQQIEKYRTAAPQTPSHQNESTFNALKGSHQHNASSMTVASTPSSFVGRPPVEASTPLSGGRDVWPVPLDATPAPAPVQLSAEQMARIAENRRLAQERLRQKREAAAMQQ